MNSFWWLSVAHEAKEPIQRVPRPLCWVNEQDVPWHRWQTMWKTFYHHSEMSWGTRCPKRPSISAIFPQISCIRSIFLWILLTTAHLWWLGTCSHRKTFGPTRSWLKLWQFFLSQHIIGKLGNISCCNSQAAPPHLREVYSPSRIIIKWSLEMNHEE